jgi:histidyl-tRNA synthetase
VVKVNNRKVLDGVLEAIGLAGADNAGQRLTVLRAIDKLDRLGVVGVRLLLGAGRKDESGDFTKGAGLGPDAIEQVMASIVAPSATNAETLAQLTKISGAAVADQGIAELRAISELLDAGGYGDGRVRIDPSVVRGLEYYTGPVYEVELTFETRDESGRPVRFGSVGGGGRYDGLVGRFRGEAVPATGCAAEPGPVVVTVFDRDRLADYQRMVQSLREAGIRAELYLGSGKFGPQMKYADKRNAPCVIIQGSDEKARGEVTIKDLVLGAEIAGLSKERDDYLKKQAEAQFAVAESELVAAVQRVLARRSAS